MVYMIDAIKPPKEYKIITPKRKKKKWVILLLILAILIVPGFYIFKTGFAFSKIITIKNIAWIL